MPTDADDPDAEPSAHTGWGAVTPGPSDAPLRAAEASLERLRQHRRLLLDFGRVALEELPLRPLLQRAAAKVASAAGVNHAKVMRYRPDMGDLLVEAGVGWRSGVVGRARLGADIASPSGRAVQTGEPVVVGDLRAESEWRVDPLLSEHGIVALANVPLAFDGRVWGVLEADSDRPRQFDTDDREFLELVACLLSGALQRADAVARSEAASAAAGLRAGREAVLLRELQHRAKNNLALVAAILARERRAAATAGEALAAERFARAMDRVSAIALAHARLTFSEGPEGDPGGAAGQASGAAVDLAGHLRALLNALQITLGERIAIETDLDGPCRLPIDRAVAAGLVVNELVTNAAKHAYPGPDESGAVRVGLRVDDAAAEAVLAVADDGCGMGDEAPDAARSPAARNERRGQGLELVAAWRGSSAAASRGTRRVRAAAAPAPCCASPC